MTTEQTIQTEEIQTGRTPGDQLVELFSGIPESEYVSVNGPDVHAVELPDRTYLQKGCADGFVRILPEDETFDGRMNFHNPAARVGKGTHILGIQDIKPFGQTSPIKDPIMRTAAKITMTRDFLEMVWKAFELDPELEKIHGFTNVPMARFMVKHWGFRIFGEENAGETLDRMDKDASVAMYATREDIEAKYEHLTEYIPELVARLEEQMG